MSIRIPVRVLVIDDDAEVCERLRAWLTDAGYEVVAFARAMDGLRHATAAPSPVALVDMRLEDASSTEVIAALRAAWRKTRVVALGAFPDVPLVLSAMQAGASDWLEKPIQQPRLLEALARQLAEFGVAARDESEFNRRLGARLRMLRSELGATQAEIADAAGLGMAQLSQIELGKTATSTWTLARLCAALRVSLQSLFERF